MLTFTLGVLLILVVLWETFETIILPRRVRRRFRLTRLYYRNTWWPFSALADRISNARRRESLLSFFGPLSLLGLLALWAMSLVVGFALCQYGLGSRIVATGETPGFALDLYLSGTTFFTLGLGDVVPTEPGGASLRRTRGFHRIRISRHRDRLSPGDLSGLLKTRSHHLDAGRTCRLATHGGGIVAAPC